MWLLNLIKFNSKLILLNNKYLSVRILCTYKCNDSIETMRSANIFYESIYINMHKWEAQTILCQLWFDRFFKLIKNYINLDILFETMRTWGVLKIKSRKCIWFLASKLEDRDRG